jgi:hypothetical protein
MSKLCHPFQAITIFSLSILFIFMANPVRSAQITLQWDPNDPAPQGYQLYHRVEGDTYNYAQPVYNGTHATAAVEVPDDGQRHFFVVRAYEGSNFSGDSNEAAFLAPSTSQQSGAPALGSQGDTDSAPTPDQGDGENANPGEYPSGDSTQTENGMIWPTGGQIVELTPDLLTQMDLGGNQALHTQTRWLISTEADFSQKVMDITSQTALTALAVPDLILDAGTLYFWKAEFLSPTGAILAQTPVNTFETLEASQSDDTNSDGIPDAQRIQSPIDVDHNGVDDGRQDDILCIKSAKGGLALGVKAVSANAHVVSAKSIDDANQSSSLNKPQVMTLGIISFKVLLQQNATAAMITVFFSEPAPADALWYKYDINAGWRIYPDAVFSEDRTSVTFSIEDGGPGDDDGVRNGIIVDPSGLGAKSMVPASAGGSPAGNKTGCFIDTLSAQKRDHHKGVTGVEGLLILVASLLLTGIAAARQNG